MFKVYENFLPKEEFLKIKEVLLGMYFPWYYNPAVITFDNTDKNFQFIHNLYRDHRPLSDTYFIVEPLIKKINPTSILRIKANLVPKANEIIEHGMHVDFSPIYKSKITTAVFYCNTNNGYTKFEDGTKIYSKENTLVTFDSNIKHTGTTCTDEKIRVVINLNYCE